MISVRLGKTEDFDAVLGLIKEFQTESLGAYQLFCNDDISKMIMQKFIGTSFVLEDGGQICGVLAGTVVTYPLNDEKIYQEWIWFVNKEHRLHGLSLYYALEDYCKLNSIKKIVMVCMANSKAAKLDAFYKRMGFELMETHYIRNIGG